MPFFSPVTARESRQTDARGSGQFGASRRGRLHQGLDIVAIAGEDVFSPIDGDLVRETVPYPQDLRYRGVLIRGTDTWLGVEVKLFYVQGTSCGHVRAGDRVGAAQDLSSRYPGITNHVHLEVRRAGQVVSPLDFFGKSF